MENQKARISGVNTKEGEGFLRGERIKKMPDNVIHLQHGSYTTCDLPHPHFQLNLTKASVVPGKKTVFGPAYLVFEDVPIYFLGLPFGFFPSSNDRSSGFIFPEVGEEVIKGFFLRDFGYYLVLGDNVDLTALAGIYTLGSWEASLQSRYLKRYKFSGNVSFDYAKDKIGEKGQPDYIDQTNIRLMWTHQQDPKANPTSNFAASVNYSSTSYNKYNATSMNDYLNSQIQSSITYSKNWAGKPFSLSVSARMSQNTRDSTYAFEMPTLNFNVQRINPFKRKKMVGKERWYEKINFTYSFEIRNSVTVKDDEFFQQAMFDKMNTRATHRLPISASFSLFGGKLSLTPNANYEENWYLRKINREYDPARGTLVNADTTRGFYRVNRYNFALTATSKLYGMYILGPKKEKPIQIRHVMTPNLSFSYTPGFDQYWEMLQSSPTGATYYSPYESAPDRRKAMSLVFNLSNTLEMKLPSNNVKDTTGYKKVKIFESLNIGSSWNFMADSLNLAPFSLSARATIVKGLTVNITGSLDPYQLNSEGRRINKFQIHKGGLARLTRLSFSFGYGFQSSASRNNKNQAAVNNPHNNNNTLIQSEAERESFFESQGRDMGPVERARMLATQYYDFAIPWSISMSYSFSYSKPALSPTISQTMNFNGSLSLTPKWGVSLGAGYDFKMKKLTPSTIQVSRDLHCFQLDFSWVPNGFRQSWSFTIRAKSAMLADLLRWKKSRSFLDNYYGY